jgi:hypothetical protein
MTHETTMVYAVWWPELNVLKVGKASGLGRLHTLAATGGQILLVMRQRPVWEEKAALDGLREVFPRAFETELSSLNVLPRGRGFTECFIVAADQMGDAMKAIFRGIARYGHEQAAVDTAGHLHGRDVDRVTDRDQVDGDRVEVASRRPREGISEHGIAPSVDMAPNIVDHRRHPHRSSARPRPGGLHRRVLGGRADMLRGPRLASSVTPARITVPSPACPPARLQRPARNFLGWGERERGRGRERRGGRSEARWISARPFLSGSPPGSVRRLPQLRNSTPVREEVGARATHDFGIGG